MDFIDGDEIKAAGGFQLSLLSVPDDLRYIIAAATGQGSGNQLDRIRERIWGNKISARADGGPRSPSAHA